VRRIFSHSLVGDELRFREDESCILLEKGKDQNLQEKERDHSRERRRRGGGVEFAASDSPSEEITKTKKSELSEKPRRAFKIESSGTT